jgi:hypothetical protein
MTPEELLFALFATVTEHIKLPAGYEWAPLAGLCVATAFGLLMLVRGARWAPGLAAFTFLGIGGAAGSFLAQAIGTPFWVTVVVVAVVGFVLGLALFRLWQAVLLSACFIIAGFSVYYVRVLTPEVQNWVSASSEPGFVTLQPAGTVVGDNRPSALTELNSLWRHLDASIPDFSTTSLVLVLSTGLAGLIFGLVLPRVSRALWAASLGMLIFGIGATALLKQFAPGVLEWLLADNLRAWSVVGAVWALSLVLNLLTCRKKTEKNEREEKAPAKSKPALA